ncbi:hypothetical protein EB03_01709 [Enterococcus hirae]|uniref:Lipoprotein n=1 Tax=Enterococcus hirae TaxID=1354 RepID=A0AB37IKI9_ENTHR|nr:hypothetical protein EB03_01709 [Enterococcus hirae]
MKKLLVTGVLASTALFLLGGCGSSSAKSNAASSSEKTSDGRKLLISGHFGDQEHVKK